MNGYFDYNRLRMKKEAVKTLCEYKPAAVIVLIFLLVAVIDSGIASYSSWQNSKNQRLEEIYKDELCESGRDYVVKKGYINDVEKLLKPIPGKGIASLAGEIFEESMGTARIGKLIVDEEGMQIFGQSGSYSDIATYSEKLRIRSGFRFCVDKISRNSFGSEGSMPYSFCIRCEFAAGLESEQP